MISDLCIDSNSTDEFALTCMRDGYNCIAFNTHKSGALTESDRCIPRHVDFQKVAHNTSLKTLNLSATTDFTLIKQYQRVTYEIKDVKTSISLNTFYPILNSYEIIALQPMDEKSFQFCCTDLECDIITLNIKDKMPFFIKHQAVEDARKRGICFEICYSTALKEDYTRTWFLKNSIQLVKATKGKGVILCSGASDEIYHRTPMEVKQIASIIGVPEGKQGHCISQAPSDVIKHASGRTFYKGAIKIS